MNQDFIERYLYAVTKRMPRKQREDVSRELRGLIDDMLSERCGGLTPTEKDIRVVLTELGTPQELWEKYDENETKCLIGQPYYGTYVFVMKIVMVCTAVGLTLSSVILQLLEPQAWYAAAGQWLSMLWQGLLSAFAIVTALFAFFYRKGIQIKEPFRLEDLPPVPKKNQEISLWEPVVGIVFCVLFTLIFLLAPELLGRIRLDSGETVPVFHVEAIRSSWWVILLFAICGITGEMVKLIERRYNKKVMWTTVVTNLVSAVLAFWWLSGANIFHPAFSETMRALFVGDAEWIGRAMGNFHSVFLGILLFALTLDTVDAVIKTLRE